MPLDISWQKKKKRKKKKKKERMVKSKGAGVSGKNV